MIKKLFLIISVFAHPCAEAMEGESEKVSYGRWLREQPDLRPILARIAPQLEPEYSHLDLPSEEQSVKGYITLKCEGELGDTWNYGRLAQAIHCLYYKLPVADLSRFTLDDAKKICGRLHHINELLKEHIVEQRIQALSNWYIVTKFDRENNLNPLYIGPLFREAFPRDARTVGGERREKNL